MEPLPTSTYVFDSESPTEMARLINQDRIVTQAIQREATGFLLMEVLLGSRTCFLTG
jgi:hypothetical protein